MPAMPRTEFTPAQANKTLPLVKRIVADILEKGDRLRRLGPRRDVAGVESEIVDIEHELQDLARELEQIGCSYKDWGFEMGLVDFPAEIDGSAVLLCWRSDEEAIRFYHTPEAGFAGRTPIPDDLLNE